MMKRGRGVSVAGVVGGALLLGACNSTSGPGNGNPPVQGSIIVLNRISGTIQQFNVDGQTLVPFGQSIGLPAGFDGEAIDVQQTGNLAVTSTGAAGGSQVIWIDLATGDQLFSGFPGAGGGVANPGRPTLVTDIGGRVGALVAAREDDDVYVAFPGQATASFIAADAGAYVQRVLPFGQFVLTIDANLDDVTLESQGEARVKLLDFDNGSVFDDVALPGTVGAIDALIFNETIAVLSSGGFDAGMNPEGNGRLVVFNVPDRGVRENIDIEGNGLSIEPGRDGLVYIARTRGAGTFDTDLLTFNFSSESFERGPGNPLVPKDQDGSDILNCRTFSALLDGRILCLTWMAAAQGRLVLLDAQGGFLDDAPVGAGATDIFIR